MARSSRFQKDGIDLHEQQSHVVVQLEVAKALLARARAVTRAERALAHVRRSHFFLATRSFNMSNAHERDFDGGGLLSHSNAFEGRCHLGHLLLPRGLYCDMCT
tara:strand:+ start:129 stop:440 length:312 start_codon:yes stop_codon:yes gene_type:complete